MFGTWDQMEARVAQHQAEVEQYLRERLNSKLLELKADTPFQKVPKVRCTPQACAC